MDEIFQAIYYVYYMTKGKSKIVTLSNVIGIILWREFWTWKVWEIKKVYHKERCHNIEGRVYLSLYHEMGLFHLGAQWALQGHHVVMSFAKAYPKT